MADADLARAAAVIHDAPSLALACHQASDGDALGSMLAVHHLCRARGKSSVASWPEPFEVAPHYRFMPGLDEAVPPADFPSRPEVMVTFDCASAGRLVELADAAGAAGELVVVDHHASNDRYGSVNVVEPEAAATAVLVRRLAAELGWELDRDAALCLYTGLATDTGRFQHSNTTPEVFALAEELASFDLPIAEVSRRLFEENRFACLRLLGECLARAELDERLRFVASWVTTGDLERHGVQLSETEGLVDLVRRAAEADVSCVLKETPEGIRVSLRSISETDVAAVARLFGGGGHRLAAGFTVPGTVPEVLAAVKDALAPGHATSTT
ncbi:MAG: bifunctional oligoribonuclease/PAP phosphatase NrnA [Actinomycetota bacterium]|nr:bifunctional oligoribonuclease/PAP phosphatase NrnA [Actinomycetota bacterium]